MTLLQFKHMLLRTPLEKPAAQLRHLADLPHRMRHPELREVFLEDDRIDQMMERVIKPDSNCIDIGCHIGSSLSAILGHAPKGKHVAFEPVPEKAQWIQKKFPEVQVKCMALGEEKAKLTFHQNVSRPGFSGFEREASGTDKIVSFEVDCERLDDIVGPDRKFTYIKMDVEGAELLVLKGARQLIARDRPVILFESAHDGAAKMGMDRDDLFNFFVDELGYDVFLLKNYLEGGPKLDLAGYQKAAVYPFQAFNFLGVPSTKQ
jgi:FkbM family methyltransferase